MILMGLIIGVVFVEPEGFGFVCNPLPWPSVALIYLLCLLLLRTEDSPWGTQRLSLIPPKGRSLRSVGWVCERDKAFSGGGSWSTS